LCLDRLFLMPLGRRRSPPTMPGFHASRSPRNNGLRYPADPPSLEEIVAVMRIAGDGLHGRRLRGLVAVLWRAGFRIDEARPCARPASIHAAAPKEGDVARSEWRLRRGPFQRARRVSNLRPLACETSALPRSLRHGTRPGLLARNSRSLRCPARPGDRICRARVTALPGALPSFAQGRARPAPQLKPVVGMAPQGRARKPP